MNESVNETVAAPRPARRRGAVARLVPWVVAAAGLAWALHGLKPAQLLSDLGHVTWGLVPVAIALDLLGYVAQAWRWNQLLTPVGAPGIRVTLQAIYAGLFVNEIVPVRFGELVRAWLVRRAGAVDLPGVFATLLLERLFDGFWLALGLGIVAILLPLPPQLAEAGDLLGIIVIAGALIFAFLLWRARRRSETTAEGGWFVKLMHHLGRIGFHRSTWAALAISILIPILEGLAMWVLVEAYGIKLPLVAGLAVFILVQMVTALPNAPGNIGTWQALCVLALGLFQVDRARAASFSISGWVILTLPLLLFGSIALSRAGLSLS